MAKKARETNYKGTGPGRFFQISQKLADSLPSFCSLSGLAKWLGLSRTVVCRWAKAGFFTTFYQPSGKFAGSYVVDRMDFLSWAKHSGRFSGLVYDVDYLKRSGGWDFERGEPTKEWLEKIRSNDREQQQIAPHPAEHIQVQPDQQPQDGNK
jgi:hypothetical protein